EESAYTATVSATTPAAPAIVPDAPTAISATAISFSQIDIVWTNPAEFDEIIIERSLDELTGFTVIATLTASETSFEDISLNAETTYYYRLKSVLGSEESVYSATVSATTPAVPVFSSVTGAIRNPNGEPIRDVELTINGSENLSIFNNLDGTFSFDYPENEAYTITPAKTVEGRNNNGVSTLDIIIIGRHMLNLTPFNPADPATPYKLIAADVNFDNQISAIDIILIRSLILGKIDGFTGSNLWRFLPNDHVFANPSNPFDFTPAISGIAGSGVNADFTAIKLGDVNDTWNPANGRNTANGYLNLVFDAPQQNEDEIIIPVRSSDFNQISGFQFTLEWDARSFNYQGIESKSLKVFTNDDQSAQGQLTLMYDNSQLEGASLHEDDILFNLKLSSKSSTPDFNSLHLNSRLTEAMAFDSQLNRLDISASFPHSESLENSFKFALFQNYPNPVENQSTFSFEAPTDGLATITIVDMNGRIVETLRQDCYAGLNEIEWQRDSSNGTRTAGVYIYKLQLNDIQAVGKMMLR
ncbi:MAG: T9SS type A sorting domain-containing protein, partial [Cyclobacteriaceae bacterium]